MNHIVNDLNKKIINPLPIIDSDIYKIFLNAAQLLQQHADAKVAYLMAQDYYFETECLHLLRAECL